MWVCNLLRGFFCLWFVFFLFICFFFFFWGGGGCLGYTGVAALRALTPKPEALVPSGCFGLSRHPRCWTSLPWGSTPAAAFRACAAAPWFFLTQALPSASELVIAEMGGGFRSKLHQVKCRTLELNYCSEDFGIM